MLMIEAEIEANGRARGPFAGGSSHEAGQTAPSRVLNPTMTAQEEGVTCNATDSVGDLLATHFPV